MSDNLEPVSYPKIIYKNPQSKLSGTIDHTPPILDQDYKIAKNEDEEKAIRKEWNLDETENKKPVF